MATIGIDCRMFGPQFTGIGNYTKRLVEYLEHRTDLTHDFVLFMRPSEFYSHEITNPQFRKVLVDAPHYSWREQVVLLRELLKARIDCMHFTHFNAPLFYRRPSVVTIHDLTLSFYPGKKMTSSLHRWAYRTTINTITGRAKKIISVSEYTKKDLVHVLWVDEDRISVIYHGIDRERFQSVSNQTEDARLLAQHYSIKQPYFLYSGVWREHKNLPRLIEAFHQFITKTGNQDMLLVIAGKEDPSYHEVRDAIIRFNLRDRVKILGFVEEAMLPVVFRNALAFTFPSLYEGFGLPVLEAMGAGVPVVCSQTTSLPEVAGSENALFFDPLSIDDIADKLIRVVSDTRLRSGLIARGKKRILDFNWDRMGAETLAVYNEVLSQNKK